VTALPRHWIGNARPARRTPAGVQRPGACAPGNAIDPRAIGSSGGIANSRGKFMRTPRRIAIAGALFLASLAVIQAEIYGTNFLVESYFGRSPSFPEGASPLAVRLGVAFLSSAFFHVGLFVAIAGKPVRSLRRPVASLHLLAIIPAFAMAYGWVNLGGWSEFDPAVGRFVTHRDLGDLRASGHRFSLRANSGHRPIIQKSCPEFNRRKLIIF